jgi:uncharacterized phage protein gp47/JayE
VTTNVPSASFSDLGFISPPESAVLAGVLADLNDAFGGNLNTALETSQGQLASSLTAIIGDKNTQFALLANQVDPSFASGRMQDAIGRIYFLDRIAAEPTTVDTDCVGAVGTVIPTGVYAVATDNNLYVCVQGGTIGPTGTLSLQFACVVTGPIPCPENSLTTIYRTIPGWDSINNATDGVLGQLTENRAQFEARRAASVAVNSVGPVPAIRGAIRAVSGVTDCFVYDNAKKLTVTYGGISIAPNSLAVIVVGGADLDVANAIWSKKGGGCGYNTGNTTVTVYDDDPDYSAPYPSYDIIFTRPTPTLVYFAITLAASNLVPSDAVTQIQNAMLSAFSGGDNGPRATIGSTIFASRFYSTIANLGSWVQIRTVFVDFASTPVQNSITMNINQMPTITAASILVTTS